MNISENFDKRRLYRGLIHEDGLPLTANDIHESFDLIVSKSDYALESVYGSGLLSPVRATYDATGIRLLNDIVLNIQGDVAVVRHSESIPFVPISALGSENSEGLIFVLGWYQVLTSSDTMREYGGVQNDVIGNNLIDPDLTIQVSKRVQFRWDIIAHPGVWDESSLTIPLRDVTGELSGSTTEVRVSSTSGDMYVMDTPEEMDYVSGSLYLIPVLSYKYNPLNSTILQVYSFIDRATRRDFIESTSEPTDIKRDGTIWYNPDTTEFKFYTSSKGFVKSATELGFLQYQSGYTSSSNSNVIPIGIESLTESDILRVLRGGLELVVDIDYSIDYATNSITLTDPAVTIGDHFIFVMTRIVDATNITSLATQFLNHVDTKADSDTVGHVSLADDFTTSVGMPGVAATPRAVESSRHIVDDSTGKSYHFGVDNGILYIESDE